MGALMAIADIDATGIATGGIAIEIVIGIGTGVDRW
jgi:hypothetical protein